ncbi:MAG: hypothetical protein L3K16_05245 [Thermoplasmata archaeon]|nr:hypothetical protein [Thermoplasmata archaeon]
MESASTARLVEEHASSFSSSPRRRATWGIIGIAVSLVVLIGAGLGNLVGGPAGGASASDPVKTSSLLALPVLGDDLSLNITVGAVHSLLKDTISYGSGDTSHRSYTVRVTATIALPLVPILLSTTPLTEWAYPQQLPGGADALPPLSDWNWTVRLATGPSDTANWSVSKFGSDLERTISWVNAVYEVVGVSTPTYSVSAWAPRTGGLESPVGALVLNPGGTWSGPAFPSYDPNYPKLIDSLSPQFVRFSILQGTFSHWDVKTKQPIFNFSGVDQSFGLAQSTGVGVFFSLAVGTWGDGNLLPKGMPLDTALPILGVTGPGFLPTPFAYQKYISTIVAHVAAANESVLYWCVGNEMPLMNRTVVLAFVQLFNIAQRIIHATFPTASVGTDVMMNRTYLTTFANLSRDVGFLSFHFYPDIGICVHNGSYCPPQGNPNGSLDKTLWESYATMADNHRFYPPAVAQSEWHNLTGRWVPVLDSESNLDGVGGSPNSNANGTDPRQQTLLGAVWLASTLIEAAAENVSSLAYFTLTGQNGTPPTITGPYGGFGYGMTSELPNGAHTLFAPYWAMRLFDKNFPVGSSGAVLPVPDSSALRAYAVHTSKGMSVLIVNLNAVRVRILLTDNVSGMQPSHLKTLDRRSYLEKYSATSDSTIVQKSGVRNVALSAILSTVPVTLYGYGMAVVHYVFVKGAGTPMGAPALSAPSLPSFRPARAAAVGPTVPGETGAPLAADPGLALALEFEVSRSGLSTVTGILVAATAPSRRA